MIVGAVTMVLDHLLAADAVDAAIAARTSLPTLVSAHQ